MLPLRLELRNFLPYRAPKPLDLRGLRLACLSGVNGAGKSALLDAITWALWGQSRARRDDDLIHFGEKSMYVQLDFEQNGAHYRVLRRRQSGARSRASLRLYERTRGEYRDISAPNLSATDERLRQLLRLDYEAFTHSAFLLQGRAHAFTARTPRERQHLLANILQLRRWEAAAARARERMQVTRAKFDHLNQQHEEIESELAHEAELAEALAAAEGAHERATKTLAAAETALAALAEAPAALRHHQQVRASASARLAEIERNRRAAAADALRWRERQQSLLAILADDENIQRGYQALRSARETDQALGARLAALREADAEINRLERHIAADRHALQTQRAQVRAQLDELARAHTPLEGAAEADLNQRIDALNQRASEQVTLRAEEEDWQSGRHQREAANQQLREEMAEILKQIQTLAGAQDEADGMGLCPLCGQALSPAHRERAQEQLRRRGVEKGDAFRENQAWLRAGTAAATARQNALREHERALLTLPELKARAQEFARQRSSQQEANQRRGALNEQLAALENTLEAEEFSAEARQQLTRALAARDSLAYDPERHSAARHSTQALADFEARHSELSNASAALPQTKEALAAAEARLAELEQAQDEEMRIAEEAAANEATLKTNLLRHREAEIALQQARAAERQEYLTLLSLRQESTALVQQRERAQALAAERRAVAERLSIYRELRRAFSSDGIPALLIEAAIPALQEDANALLAQLSESPLRLEMSLKRRGQFESLEILVRDAIGARSHELFSGGEAFRIHFALRVALARTVARRAGTELRALFVDEGFGTQDAGGREGLVRALNAIQTEFALILVITHLEELRAAFPRQIFIHPTAEGSQWELR